MNSLLTTGILHDGSQSRDQGAIQSGSHHWVKSVHEISPPEGYPLESDVKLRPLLGCHLCCKSCNQFEVATFAADYTVMDSPLVVNYTDGDSLIE